VHGNGDGNATRERRHFDFGPRLAFVRGFVKRCRLRFGSIAAVAGSAAAKAAGALRRCEHDLRIVVGVFQVARAIVIRGLQHVGPGLAAIGGAIDTAAVVIDIAKRGDEHQVGIGGIDHDAGDFHHILEPHVLPAFAGIGRLPHTVAEAAANRVPGSGINDVGIGWSDLDSAEAIHARLLIEDREPGHACAGRLPNAAQRRTHVERAGIADDTAHGGDASAMERPDVPPLEPRIEVGIHLRSCAQNGYQHAGENQRPISCPRLSHHSVITSHRIANGSARSIQDRRRQKVRRRRRCQGFNPMNFLQNSPHPSPMHNPRW